MEIDFLIRREGGISPIEVKSAAYQHHASLDKFIRKFRGRLGTPYILYTKDVMERAASCIFRSTWRSFFVKSRNA